MFEMGEEEYKTLMKRKFHPPKRGTIPPSPDRPHEIDPHQVDAEWFIGVFVPHTGGTVPDMTYYTKARKRKWIIDFFERHYDRRSPADLEREQDSLSETLRGLCRAPDYEVLTDSIFADTSIRHRVRRLRDEVLARSV